MTTPELVFALPAGSAEISGGNLYNDKLLRALLQHTTVTVLNVAECLARVAQGRAGYYFIDSLDLDSFRRFPSAGASQRYGLIVHHLPSLEPGIAPEDPALELERTVLPRFDVLLATSPFTAEHLRARGARTQRIAIVPPAPPGDSIALPLPSPPFVFLMVGNLIPRKGVLELLECLASHVGEHDRFQLELAGRTDLDPEYAAACLQAAQRAELRSIVRYLGPVPHDRIADCYRRAAAFVSTSQMETFGMALQEASAYGLPILAVDAGYARHHVTSSESGACFASVEALALELLAWSRDPIRMRALFAGAQRLRAARDYTWADAAALLLRQLSA